MLPQISSRQDYGRLYTGSEVWLPAVREIAVRHRLSGSLRRQVLGTHVVFGVGAAIIKMFCPLWLDDFRTERAALAHIDGLPTPEIIGEGELEGWPYLILSRCDGVPAAQVWPSMSYTDRRSIVQQLGRLMAVLHRHPLPDEMADDWELFLRQRLMDADRHHGMAEPWGSWIRDQLANFQESPAGRVLLNGDLTEDHVLLTEQKGGWVISGLIDFGDARVGHPYYDFVAPLAYYTYGQPALSQALIEAYGLCPTEDLFDVLIKYCLLHEFGRLSDFLDRFPVGTPEQFYEGLWGRVPTWES